MTETFDLIPSVYAFGGETIAHLPDGRAVFIPFCIPNERVRIELVDSKPGFARARLIEVLEPSSQRIAPALPTFRRVRRLSVPAYLLSCSDCG